MIDIETATGESLIDFIGALGTGYLVLCILCVESQVNCQNNVIYLLSDTESRQPIAVCSSCLFLQPGIYYSTHHQLFSMRFQSTLTIYMYISYHTRHFIPGREACILLVNLPKDDQKCSFYWLTFQQTTRTPKKKILL